MWQVDKCFLDSSVTACCETASRARPKLKFTLKSHVDWPKFSMSTSCWVLINLGRHKEVYIKIMAALTLKTICFHSLCSKAWASSKVCQWQVKTQPKTKDLSSHWSRIWFKNAPSCKICIRKSGKSNLLKSIKSNKRKFWKVAHRLWWLTKIRMQLGALYKPGIANQKL